MKLIFVRHGKTHFNELDIKQGWCDSPLSKTGEKQVASTALQLKDYPITKAYSSPLGRAIQTAKAMLVYHDLPLQLDDRLKEINFGKFEGITCKFVDTFHLESSDWLTSHNMDYTAYEGGHIKDVIKAHKDFVEEIIKESNEEDILLMTGHGCSLSAYIRSILPEDQEFTFMENAGAVIIDYNNGNFNLEKIISPKTGM